ncbi:MAG: metallophosphoesterase [Eubacteriales bacterium]
MITLQKSPERDFLILNLTDPQLDNDEWDEHHKNYKILTTTIRSLIEKNRPDLITVSGDLAWAGCTTAYRMFADFLDSFKIPWAPVWGNHDNQGGPASVDAVADMYLAHEYCVYEKGDPALGNGNYVIAIEENGRVVEGVLMMDSHDQMPFVSADGNSSREWAKLIPEQLDWYREQVGMLQKLGCSDTTMVMHIPIYAYREAFDAAFRGDLDSGKISVEESYGTDCWNDGYQDSFGVKYEGICSYPADEGAFDVMLELGSTKHIVCGHDHVNNYVIRYRGVTFIYGLKAGAGCYWNPSLNGGTYLRVTQNGVTDVWHEYVDVSDLLHGES